MADALQILSTTVEDEPSQLSDERLLLLAQTRGSRQARDVLIVRHFDWVVTRVDWLAGKYNLSKEDHEDANQDAVLWFFEAITHFDIEQIDRLRECSFRSFVYNVVSMRFKDFLRRLERLDRYKKQLPLLGYSTDEGRRHLAAYLAGNVRHTMCDAIASAEIHEMVMRLHAVLQQQDRSMKEMGELLSAGVSLHEIALRQGISYDAAKRRRRKMLKHLRYCLSE